MFQWINKDIWWFLFCTAVSFSAEDNTLTIARDYYNEQNYSAAITEYKRFIFFNPEDSRTFEALQQIGFAYRKLFQWEKAIATFDKAVEQSENDSIRDLMKMNIAITMIACQNYVGAELQLARLVLFSHSLVIIRKAKYFMGIVYLYKFQWEDARIYFHQYYDTTSSITSRKIDSLLSPKNLPENKSTYTAKLFSSIIPGSGQFYAEQYGDGINGLLINSALGYLIVHSVIENRYQDAAIAFLPLFYRYYEGNRINAEREVIQHNNKVNSEQVDLILSVLLSDEINK